MKSAHDDDSRCPTPEEIWGPGGLTEQIQAERKIDRRRGIRRSGDSSPVEVMRAKVHPPRGGVEVD